MKFVNYQLDVANDNNFPLKIESTKRRKTVRSKYLVGDDGAHFQVRRSMELHLERVTTDRIWGVVD
jgi:phenol 2-monooxygenase